LSTRHIQCLTPKMEQVGNLQVALLIDCNHAVDSAIDFEYFAPIRISKISPFAASQQKSITVEGDNFPSSHRIVCKFGHSGLSIGFWKSSTEVQCVVPQVPPGNVTVSVVSEPYQSQRGGLSFEILQDLKLERIEPSSGPANGVVQVLVVGSGFDSGVGCSFGRLEVAPIMSNRTHMLCDAPTGMPGTVPFSVFSPLRGSTSKLTFVYLDFHAPSIDWMSVTAGPQDGVSPLYLHSISALSPLYPRSISALFYLCSICVVCICIVCICVVCICVSVYMCSVYMCSVYMCRVYMYSVYMYSVYRATLMVCRACWNVSYSNMSYSNTSATLQHVCI